MIDYSAVIFDLDGTLLDTLADIANSANAVLARHGFRTHPVESYRRFVGEGVATLFARALPANAGQPERIRQFVEQFREAYDALWNVHSQPYPQVPRLLDALAAKKIRMAVLSNKPDVFTKRCVAEFLPGNSFAVVLGQRDCVPCKPDPTGAWEIVESLQVPPDRFLYLGDSAVDMQTARGAGMHPIGALWGFRSRAELVESGAEVLIEQPMELLEI